MKLLRSIFAAVVAGTVTQIPTATAFTTVTYVTRPSSSTQLHSVEDMRQRINNAGSGITTIVPGNLSIYDPDATGGKLQGTGDLQKRLSAGASFPGKTASAPASPTTAAPSAPPSGGMANLSNLLNSVRLGGRGEYGGKSQC